ncbi:MAG: dihydrofolate reductase [Melioribacteraceae bacterium]|nr:dihydrofolate reductase [Melioribacteraceae bacterium]
MEIIIITAAASNGAIGKNGAQPWYCKEELTHFIKTTIDYPVIMGSVTMKEINNPLSGRENLVLTSKSHKDDATGFLYFNSMGNAISYCNDKDYKKLFIIGGESVYKLAMEIADRIVISIMDFAFEGDRFFPEIDLNKWVLEKEDRRKNFVIYDYKRKV